MEKNQCTHCRQKEEEVKIHRAVLNSCGDAIIITDRKGLVKLWNEGAEKLTGFAREEIEKQDILNFFLSEQRENGKWLSELLQENKGSLQNVQALLKKKDGGRIPVILTVNYVPDDRGKITRIVGVAKDMRAVKELEENILRKNKELQKLVVTDETTGLYNQRRFNEVLRREFSRARRFNHPLSLMVIDIDDFKKNINDKFGHGIGNRILSLVGSVLRQFSRDIDVAARWGGEEFVVVMPETNITGATELADKIRVGIREAKISLDNGKKVGVTATIGIATYPDHTESSADGLFDKADAALYRGKALGKDTTVVCGHSI